MRKAPILFFAIVVLGSALVLLTGCLGGRTRREIAAEYFNLGNAFFALEKYDQALDYYQRALDYSSRFPEGGYNLARVYILLERYPEAVDILQKLLAEDGDNLTILHSLAYAYGRAGRVDQAVETYGEILVRSEGNLSALYNLSLLREAQGESRAAYELLSQAVRLDPEDPDLLRRMGRLEARYGSRGAAIDYLKSYREKRGDDGETAFFLVQLLEEEGLYSEALPIMEGILQKDRERPEMQFEYAYLLLTKAEEKNRGLNALSRAAELGFDDRGRVEALLLEVPEALLGDVRQGLIDGGLLSAQEVEKVLAAPFEDTPF